MHRQNDDEPFNRTQQALLDYYQRHKVIGVISIVGHFLRDSANSAGEAGSDATIDCWRY